MIIGRKNEIAILKQALDTCQQSQQNIENLASAVNNYIDLQSKENAPSEYKEDEQRRAAYALNLCTVSISQIIDYEDLNVLEQEYNAILNNLNLENIPKDEALLNILKQILDTVTFFRIQKGDREMIEKEYQHKMKNAIWSAVPNFGAIIATGNPWAAAATLATQVGIGYMNYRRTKAETCLEKDQKEWQLQRTAIEQLNGLRRELFDTSWRLAEEYNFHDEWRLTEKQISQYDDILMDPNKLRRYYRFEAISNEFEVYPDFWYQYGHTACELAYNQIDDNLKSEYLEKAVQCFDKYIGFEINEGKNISLLRENTIASSCALEYIDLLFYKGTVDLDKVNSLLKIAIDRSGKACDVLQLCALEYLKIENKDEAIKVLHYLVNENYNTVLNAQMISIIYADNIQKDNQKEYYFSKYDELTNYVTEELLFPLPDEKHPTMSECQARFIESLRSSMVDKYNFVIDELYSKYELEFSRILPLPNNYRNNADEFYSLNQNAKTNAYLNEFNVDSNFKIQLSNSNIGYNYVELLNDLVDKTFEFLPSNKGLVFEKQLCPSIRRQVSNSKSDFENLLKISESEFKNLISHDFDYYTSEFFGILKSRCEENTRSMNNMSDFSMEESRLQAFCKNHKLADLPEIIEENNTMTKRKEYYISFDLLGAKAKHNAEVSQILEELNDIFVKEIKDCMRIKNKDKQKTHIYNITEFDVDDFNDIINKKPYCIYQGDYKNKIFAIVHQKKIAGTLDLVFTTDGIILDENKKHIFDKKKFRPAIIPYANVKLTNGVLVFDGKEKYENKEINPQNLQNLLFELSKKASIKAIEIESKSTKAIENKSN